MDVDLDKLLIDIELLQMSKYLKMIKQSLSNEAQKLNREYRLELENEVETYEEADEVKEHYQNQLAELYKHQ